jgi:hypothetical protein
MKYYISLLLYYIGDIISRTTMQFGNGFGYSVYQKVMLWSCDLDSKGKIWKYVEPKKTKRKRK